MLNYLLYGFGILFIIYHIFGQPRLFKTSEDIVTETLFHFAGLLAAGSVAYLLIALGEELSFREVFDVFLPYLFFVTGCLLILVDIIFLFKRYNKQKGKAAPKTGPNVSNEEIEDLKIQIERLDLEIELHKIEIKAKNETIEALQKKQYDFDLKVKELDAKVKELDAKEKDLIKWQKELEQEKIQNDQMIEVQLKQKQSEYQKMFDEKVLEIKQNLQESYNKKMAEFMDSVTEKLEKRIHSEKKNLVDDVFKFDGSSRDDIFELKRTKENMDKEKETIEKNKFKLELDDLVSKSKEHVLEAKTSALDVKSENVDLRSDLKLMAGEFKNELLVEKTSREKSVDEVLHKLELEEERRKSQDKDVENKIALLSEQTKGQIIELASIVSNNLKDLEMRTMSSLREVRENMSDMKLQFGQEVMRLDSQQGQIINELEKYYIKSQEFVNKCQGLALEARKQNMEGQNVLNQVDHLYKQHRVDAKAMENRLQNSMDQVAVKEGHLANTIGDSMLKLKEISDEQYIAAKDLALEKKGADVLWKEKNLQHDMNLQEVRHQKQDLDRTKQFFDQEKSNFINRKDDMLQNARLEHNLHMTERRYDDALRKAQSSNGFLTRVAKVAEHAFANKK